MSSLHADDLVAIVDAARDDLRCLDGTHLLLTGGTGFVGSWLLESAVAAQRALGIQISITVPSRDPLLYVTGRPHLADAPGLRFIKGDVRQPLSNVGRPDAVIHAATEASASLNEERPSEMLDVIVKGMTTVLELAEQSGDIPFLFTSSGAVYGKQPPGLTLVPESYMGAPDVLDPQSAYHEGKRLSELLGTLAASRSSLRFVSARLFAFLGPLLPLDRHFAAGNFIRDALAGSLIRVGGDGTPRRSYLHPVDMTIWLWALLTRGAPGRAYNVGSESELSIADLARLIAGVAGSPGVSIAVPPVAGSAQRYVPSTARARTELGLDQTIELEEAVRRTLRWHRGSSMRP